jgi:CBS domain containing-hemolysin-like protein
MSAAEWLLAAVIVLLVLGVGLFAMAETSITRMSRVKAIALEEEGRRGSRRLVRLLEHPERVLNPILLLVLVFQLLLATLVGVLTGPHGAAGVAIGFVFEVVVIFVLAESAPKTWAIQHPDRSALLLAPLVDRVAGFWPIRMITRGLIGLSNFILPGKGRKDGPTVSEEELRAFTDVAVEEDVLEREERALIHSIIEFGDTVVREVMVPRPDMVSVEARDRISDVLEVSMTAGYSRIPVYEQNIDDIVGLVYAKDLMRATRDERPDVPVRELLREAKFVPETKRVAELMREMQADKSHMAIVVDEYGGTAGLVTLEDLIEELVGEIVDEYDVEDPLFEPLPGGDVRVNARMPIDELNSLLNAELPEGDWDTVGGLLFNLLGHVPTEGESVDYDGHRLRAEKVQGRRIGRVRISKLEGAKPERERE